MSAGSTLRIADFDGTISVVPGDGNDVVVHGDRTGDVVFQVLTQGDNVTICAYPDGHGSCDERGVHGSWNDDEDGHRRAHFRVSLPAGIKLDAKTGDGRVDVRGVQSDVIASTGDGDVDIADVRGSVMARTGDGRVHVSTVSGPVEATTGDGDVDIEIAPPGKSTDVRARTGDGTVTLYLPVGFAGQLDANTGDGQVMSDLPLTVDRGGRFSPRHFHGTIGGGGESHIDVSTGDGDVRIRQHS